MKNKLLLTTAIASVAFAGSTFAETKIGGNLEQTFQAQSEDNSDESTGRGFGAEHNISLKASKDLDNGLSAKYGTVLEDGNADTHYLTVGTDTVSVTVGRDTGNNLSSTAIPHISDQAGTIVGLTSATYDNIEVGNAHDKEHMSLDFKVAGGTLTGRYAPDMSTARPGDSAAEDSGKSATEFLYSGSLGIDGLSLRVGQSKENGQGAEEDGKAERYDIAYNFGQFAVGIGRDESESTDLTAAQVDTETDKAGITFAASDTVSLGLNYLETEKKTGGTKAADDEEIIMVSVGYNFGGLGLEMTYAEIENAGNTANTDAETFQIRTIQKF